MIQLKDKPDPKYEKLQKRLHKAVAYNCAITGGIGLMVFVTITCIIIGIFCISHEMQMSNDVRELSEMCDLAIESLIYEDENAGEILIMADSKIDEIKKKYSI